MEQRIIKLQIANEYIMGAGGSVGAVGSHDDVLLEMDFRSSALWAGTTRRAIFANALGENRTPIILTTNLLEEGQTEIYLVPVPQEAKEVAGECFLTIEGFVTDGGGKEIVRCVTEEAKFRVLPSKLYTNDTDPITPSQAEQLQAEIDDIKQKIILAAQAANSAEAAEEAKKSAEEAKDSAELNARNARVMAEGGKYETKSGEISSFRAVPGAKNYANQAYVFVEGGTFDDNPFDDIPSTIRSDGAKNLADKAKAFAEGGSYKEWEKNGLNYEWKSKTVEKGAKQYAEAAESYKSAAATSADDSKNCSENSAKYSYRSKVYAVGETILSKGFSVSAGEKKIFNTVGPDGSESSLNVPFVEVGRLYSIKVGTETKIFMATEAGISAFGLIITNAGSTDGVYSYCIENTNDSDVSGSILSAFYGGKSAKEYAEDAKTDADRAEAATVNTPKVQNGNWWVYDQTAGAYVDSGVSAYYKPVRGTDYWTEEDQAAIVNDVLAALPVGTEVSY